MKAAILADLEGLMEMAERIGSKADRLAVAGLQGKVNAVLTDDMPSLVILAATVDEYTGTKYQVQVRDRRVQTLGAAA